MGLTRLDYLRLKKGAGRIYERRFNYSAWRGYKTGREKSIAGTRAKLFTSDLSFGKIAEIRVINKNRYGRTAGKVILPDGKMLNKELLRTGLIWHYKQFDHSVEFARLEQQARPGIQRTTYQRITPDK